MLQNGLLHCTVVSGAPFDMRELTPFTKITQILKKIRRVLDEDGSIVEMGIMVIQNQVELILNKFSERASVIGDDEIQIHVKKPFGFEFAHRFLYHHCFHVLHILKAFSVHRPIHNGQCECF